MLRSDLFTIARSYSWQCLKLKQRNYPCAFRQEISERSSSQTDLRLFSLKFFFRNVSRQDEEKASHLDSMTSSSFDTAFDCGPLTTKHGGSIRPCWRSLLSQSAADERLPSK